MGDEEQAEDQTQARLQTQFQAALVGGGKGKAHKRYRTHTRFTTEGGENTITEESGLPKRRETCHTAGSGAEKEPQWAVWRGRGGHSEEDEAWLCVKTLAAKMLTQLNGTEQLPRLTSKEEGELRRGDAISSTSADVSYSQVQVRRRAGEGQQEGSC